MNAFSGKWLLLIHQIPPKPAYFRAKVLRRLHQIGALAIKNSAYVLPHNDELLEDFQWILKEITEEGGEAWLFQTDVIGGLSDDTLEENFRKLRAEEYAALNAAGQALQATVRALPQQPELSAVETEFRKLKRRSEEVRRIDFFQAPGREELDALLLTIDGILYPSPDTPAETGLTNLTGRTWVTRSGIKVDRMASAWLIRRLIDPAARFVYVDPTSYAHEPDHLRFDMFEGEFTHQGNLCTFEVLLDLSGSSDLALRAIGEIVHDLDLKDNVYQRAETGGIKAVINGITLEIQDDSRRLEIATLVFEALYRFFQTTLTAN
ncbi:MAG: chromate resistance protein [Acidobacteria bacterium]|nr:chromate resistance protein [Acidobacteriota bacterium]